MIGAGQDLKEKELNKRELAQREKWIRENEGHRERREIIETNSRWLYGGDGDDHDQGRGNDWNPGNGGTPGNGKGHNK